MEKKNSLRGLTYAAIFGAATAAGAYIIIPFPVVPITLQTLFVALSAGLLGGRLGAASQLVYLLLGIIGLPVFAGGKGGIGVLFGPTGGYLIGFLVGAYVIGKIVEVKERPGVYLIAGAIAIGYIVIYMLGVAQLALVAKMGLGKAVSVGVIPFLAGDCLKLILATAVITKLRGRIRL